MVGPSFVGVPEEHLKAAAEIVVGEQNAAAERIQKEAKIRANRNARGKKVAGVEREMSVPPESFHYWGKRLGYKCWDDPKFKAEYKRDNPWCVVHNEVSTTKVTHRGVPWSTTPPSESEGWKRVGTKWRKVYA